MARHNGEDTRNDRPNRDMAEFGERLVFQQMTKHSEGDQT